MSYLVGKILFCLVLAFATGLVLAWLLRRSLAVSRELELQGQFEQRVRSIEQDRDTQLAKLKAETDEARAQIPTLEASLADRSDLIAQLQSELDGWKRRLPPLEERIRGREEQMAALSAEAEASRVECERLGDELGRRDRQLSERRAQADAARKEAGAGRDENAQLREALAVCEDTISELRSRLAANEQGAEQAQLEAGRRSEVAAEREAALQAARQEVTAWRERYEALKREHAAALVAASVGDRPDWLIEPPGEGRADDLKRVRGIGPVLEKTLNGLGVHLYRQLGSMSDADVAWLARHVNTFPGRIRRDRWIEQARDLHRDKYGDDIQTRP